MFHIVVGWPYVSISYREAFTSIVEIFLSDVAKPCSVHVRAEGLGEPPAVELHPIYPTALATGADPGTYCYQ
jgi:hypothetical protein